MDETNIEEGSELEVKKDPPSPERLRQNESSKIVNAAINFVTTFYGVDEDIEFYKEKIYEFLRIFYSKEWTDFILKFIYFDRYDAEIYKAKTKITKEFQEFREQFDLSFVKYYSIKSILYLITTYDTRISLSLMFVFGLIPRFSNAKEFLEEYQLSPNFIPRQARAGFTLLFNDLKRGRALPYIEREFFIELLDSITRTTPQELIRFTNGELVDSGTATYELCKVLYENGELSGKALTQEEKRFVKLFTAYFSGRHLFTEPEVMMRELDISAAALNNLINNVLIKLTTKANYIMRTDASIHKLDPESVEAQLIEMARSYHSLSSNPVLTPDQSQYLTMLFKLRFDGVFPSFGMIAQFLNVTRDQVYDAMNATLEKLKSYYQGKLFDHNGNSLRSNSARVKLAAIHRDINYRRLLNTRELTVLDLLMRQDRNKIQFLNSLEDIATQLEVEGEKGMTMINNTISRLIRLASEVDTRKIDQNNSLIGRSHLRLIEALEGISDKQLQMLNKPDRAIVRKILSRDKKNRYKSFKQVGDKLGLTEKGVRTSVRRISNLLSPKKFKRFPNRPTNIVDHRGQRLKPNVTRWYLRKVWQNPDYRVFFREDELEILDLYMLQAEDVYLYSQVDIAGLLGLQDETAVEVQVRKFMAVYLEMSSRLVNENGKKLKPQHTEVIQTIEKIGLENLSNILTDVEMEIAEILIRKENGRNLSYKLIAERLYMDMSTIKRIVRRILNKTNIEQ